MNNTLSFENAPELLTRKAVEKLTGGLVKAKTLANKDSLGEGPAQRLKVMGKVAYPKQAVIDWLMEGMEVEDA